VRTSAARLGNNIHTFDVAQGRICGPTCAAALATLNHFRFISWDVYMRRHLDGVVGNVGLWRLPRVLSVLKPSKQFLREATSIELNRFNGTDTRLLMQVGPLQQRLARLRAAPLTSDRVQAIGSALRAHPRLDERGAVARATLSVAETAAAMASDDFLLSLMDQGRHLTGRVAPDGTPLAILFVPDVDGKID